MLDGVLILLAPVLIGYLLLRIRSGMRVAVAGIWAILGIYALWAADLLFFPLIVDAQARATDLYIATSMGHWINLVPFSTILDQVNHVSGTTVRQLVGNIGLLLPLGLFGPIVVRPLRSLWRLALAATLVSAAIELVQLAGTLARVLERSVDVDDVILNVAGALVGWLVWRVSSELIASRTGSSEPDTTSASPVQPALPAESAPRENG